MEPVYKLSLQGNGISVTKDVTEDTARRVLNLLLGAPSTSGIKSETHYTETSKEDSNINNAANNKKPNQSLREYLDEVNAIKNTDVILGIASYIVNNLGEDDFGPEDIRKYFSQAGEKMPGNFGRDFRWVALNGWIAQSHNSPGRYYITKTGNRALNEKFPKELSKPQPGYSKRRNSKVKNGSTN